MVLANHSNSKPPGNLTTWECHNPLHNYGLHESTESVRLDWIGLSSVLRPLQHSIGYMGDGFYRSKDPTNSIKVLKEKAAKEKT